MSLCSRLLVDYHSIILSLAIIFLVTIEESWPNWKKKRLLILLLTDSNSSEDQVSKIENTKAMMTDDCLCISLYSRP